MNTISDLYLFPRNQLGPSLIQFSHISVSSIVDCAQAFASHRNTYQTYLFSSRHYPPSINSYPIFSSVQHQNSLLFILPAMEVWNCLPLHIRISSSLSTLKKKHFFNLFYLNSTISSLGNSPLQAFSLSPFIINLCTLYLAIYTLSSFSTN